MNFAYRLIVSTVFGMTTWIGANAHQAYAQSVPELPFYPEYNDVVSILNDFPGEISTVRNLNETFGNASEPLKALIISDNPQQIEHEPVILLTGVIHGRELLGLRSVLTLADHLTSNYPADPAIRDIVDNYQIVIVPIMNIYGYENLARKNGPSTNDPLTSGVDLNRNGKFGWDRCANFSNAGPAGSMADCLNPEKGRYHGPVANSEFETDTMQSLVNWLKPVFGVVFHAGTPNSGTYGEILYPYSTSDSGEDRIRGTDDDVVLPRPEVGANIGRDLASIMANAVYASRLRAGGRFCDGTSEVPGACRAPYRGLAGSAGSTVANYYALTGMIELLVETHDDVYVLNGERVTSNWHQPFLFADKLPQDSRSRGMLEDAREYARNYADGIQGMLQGVMCSASPSPGNIQAPGFTGQVVDQSGLPVEATIKVVQFDTTLHGDFIDVDPDPNVTRLEPRGDEDFQFRRAQADTGRFYRLLPRNPNIALASYDIEVSADGYATQTFTTTGTNPDGCIDDLGEIVLMPDEVTPLGICMIPPVLTGLANGSVLPAGNATLSWTSNGCHYWVYLGSAPDQNDYHNQSMAGATSVNVTAYPSDGSDVFLTLLYRNTNIIGAPWKRAYFNFKAPQDSLCNTPPSMTSHEQGATLQSGGDTLAWTSNGCHYWVYVGDAPDQNNYHNQSMAGATSVSVSGYPEDGSEVYLTLLHRNTNIIGAPWKRAYFQFIAP